MSPPRARLWTTLVALVLALLCPGEGRAWTEARPSGFVTEVTVDPDGGALVTLRVRWTVLGGRMVQFELAGLPSDLRLVEATALSGNGVTVPITTRTPSPGRLDVSLGDDARGVRRGTLDVRVVYATSLRAQGLIRRAGADAVLEVSTVPWSRGLEGAELRVALPRTVRQAQWLPDDTTGVEVSTSTELSRDLVHAVRRHVPAGEAWTVRVAVDPVVFPWLSSDVARRPAAVRRARHPWPQAAGLVVALAVVVALLARSLARVAPPSPRSPRASAALALVAVTAQGLHVLDVPGALALGTALLLVAVGLRLPASATRLAAVDAPSRPLAEPVVRALRAADAPTLRALAAVVCVGAVAASLVASSMGVAWATVALVDLALALVASLAWWLRARPAHDLVALAPVADRLRATLRRGGRARLSWRLRGELAARGAVRLRVVALPGWRAVRGLGSLEFVAVTRGGALGDACVARAVATAAAGSPAERTLRLLAARAGELTVSPEEASLTWRCDLEGPDGDVALAGLGDAARELFARAPQGIDEVGDAARAADAQPTA